MDFGGLMTMETAQQSETSNGSGQLKQQRSGPCDDNIWRPSKVPKPADDLSAYCKQQGPTSTLFMRSDSPNDGRGHSTMLSFSSNKSEEIPFLSTNNVSAQHSSTNLPFPLFDSGSYNTRVASAYASGGSNENTPGSFSRFRGPFTPSQWMELEHQALIYKHFVANIPVPHHLLIPIKKSVNPYAFSGLSADPYASSNWGWGTFHLGFAGNTDPEPGRCRRTDGKKWRCSREAVPDQKYCERHINRGRHRSRKHVEVQNGHAVSGSTTSKVASVAPSSSATVISSSGTLLNNGGASNSLGTVQQQLNSLQPSAANPNTEQLVNRMLGHRGASVISPTICVKPKDSAISVQKQHNGVELSLGKRGCK